MRLSIVGVLFSVACLFACVNLGHATEIQEAAGWVVVGHATTAPAGCAWVYFPPLARFAWVHESLIAPAAPACPGGTCPLRPKPAVFRIQPVAHPVIVDCPSGKCPKPR